jgi:hypothetical protein
MPSAHCGRYSPTRAKSYHLPASASGSHDAQTVVSHSRQRYSQIPAKKSTATFAGSTKRPTVSVPRHRCPQGWRLSVRATGVVPWGAPIPSSPPRVGRPAQGQTPLASLGEPSLSLRRRRFEIWYVWGTVDTPV